MLIGVAGGGVTVAGYGAADIRAAIDAVPHRDVEYLSSSGAVRLSGTVRRAPDHDTFTASMDGPSDCVAEAWRVHEWDERGKGSRWEQVTEVGRAVPFVLEDGSESVLVDPVGDTVSVYVATVDTGFLSSEEPNLLFEPFEVVETVGAGEQNPPVVESSLAGRDLPEQDDSITNVADVGKAHGDREYSRSVIREGEEVFVIGCALPRDPAERDRLDDETDVEGAVPLRPETTVVTGPPAAVEGPWVLSAGTYETLRAQFDGVWKRKAHGAVGLLAGAGLLIWGLLG